MAAIAQGPAVVPVDTKHKTFYLYAGGVISSSECGTAVDHAVLAVGYGTDAATGLDYYLIKNTWGEDWGENGYVRIMRGGDDPDGICGV